jgi:hypothetical protein
VRKTVLTIAAVVVLAAGCGGDDPPERADTVEGASPSATEGDEAGEPEDVAGEALNAEQAEAALLTLEDLPTGWTVDASEETDSEDTTDPAECAALFDSLNEAADPVAEAKANFTAGGGFGPFLVHDVTSHESDLTDHIGEIVDALDQCPEFSMTDAEGVTTELTTAPLSFPNLGERTLALRIQGSTPDLDVAFDVVWIAIGQNGITLVAGGILPMQGAEIEDLATRAVHKLEAAVDS